MPIAHFDRNSPKFWGVVSKVVNFKICGSQTPPKSEDQDFVPLILTQCLTSYQSNTTCSFFLYIIFQHSCHSKQAMECLEHPQKTSLNSIFRRHNTNNKTGLIITVSATYFLVLIWKSLSCMIVHAICTASKALIGSPLLVICLGKPSLYNKNVKLTHNSTPEVMRNKWKILWWKNFGGKYLLLKNIHPWEYSNPVKINLWKVFTSEKY